MHTQISGNIFALSCASPSSYIVEDISELLDHRDPKGLPGWVGCQLWWIDDDGSEHCIEKDCQAEFSSTGMRAIVD